MYANTSALSGVFVELTDELSDRAAKIPIKRRSTSNNIRDIPALTRLETLSAVFLMNVKDPFKVFRAE